LISILSLVVALLIGGRWILPIFTNQAEVVETRELWVGDVMVEVEVADEEGEMNRGLGYRDSLGKNNGMLFIYPEPVIPTFWMKGMRFNLDFVWIYEGVVMEITENVQSPISEEEQLPLIRPKELVNWILEVNAGWVEENGGGVGDVVKFK